MKIRLLVSVPLVALAMVALLTGCTKSSPGGSSSSPASSTASTPVALATTPVAAGPTTTKTESSCPFLSEQNAANNAGMRLDKITVQRSGGKVVGCRFYPLEHPNDSCDQVCLSGEKLPPGNQPAVEIETTKYSTTTAAHNAFIRLAKKGKNFEQDQIAKGNIGLCYETDFWSHDDGKDWACTFSKGTTVVVIRTVVVGDSTTVVDVASAVEPKV